jgi:hypothetical protein
MFLIAEYRSKDALVEALLALKGAGLTAEDLAVFSEEPIEFRKGILDRHSNMSKAAVAGAVTLGTLATWFVYYAQHNYELITGGMPIFSFWATGIITYETTMLGAVLATFFWFLWESGLIRRRDPEAPIPVIGPASMSLRVKCDSARADSFVETLRRTGAIKTERRGK